MVKHELPTLSLLLIPVLPVMPADDPTQRERAVKAGGVIGEDKKK